MARPGYCLFPIVPTTWGSAGLPARRPREAQLGPGTDACLLAELMSHCAPFPPGPRGGGGSSPRGSIPRVASEGSGLSKVEAQDVCRGSCSAGAGSGQRAGGSVL